MTVKQLIKKLQKIDRENPGKRLKVSIDTQAAKGKYNDVFEIVDITDFKISFIEMADGDGISTGKYHENLIIS